MFPIRGIFETAVRVKDLSRSETFYCETLGLTIGLRDESRKWLFLRAGEGMVVLQEDKTCWPAQHFAFGIEEADLEIVLRRLSERGISFEGPTLHEWLPAKSIYFSDPDGHELEFCAPLANYVPARFLTPL
jgi:catechol-2,3-dioxygenase